MNIVLIGDTKRAEELKARFTDLDLNCHESLDENAASNLPSADIIFDLNLDDNPNRIETYTTLENKIIVGCSVKRQLASMLSGFEMKSTFVGMNCLPTFINRNALEIGLYNDKDKSAIEEVFKSIDVDILLIKDRVGMITPRVVLMIINEACYTLQEGTASIEDIDLGMKLGTNYPQGPFEWADKIGIKDVYETLLALYNDTRDERYKICPLLKTKYLKEECFYK